MALSEVMHTELSGEAKAVGHIEEEEEEVGEEECIHLHPVWMKIDWSCETGAPETIVNRLCVEHNFILRPLTSNTIHSWSSSILLAALK